MSGFRNKSYNAAFETGFFEKVIEHLIKSSGKMKTDCVNDDNKLYNNEDAITNRLVEIYLNKNDPAIRYILQAPENFDVKTDQFKGRVDIKVILNNRFISGMIYYIIECKRINGKSDLNTKYVNEGVARFIGDKPKYSSKDKRNIMFGYVVEPLDIPENTKKIEGLQKSLLKRTAVGGFALVESCNPEHYIYKCQYQSGGSSIELSHLFYNFSDVIRHEVN